MITVHHHLEGYPPTQWPVNCGYFKVLVHLDPGPNRLRFDFTGAKIPCTSSTILVNYLPLTSSPPLYLAIVLAMDSLGEYECQIERKQREGNDIRMAKRKLRMAAYVKNTYICSGSNEGNSDNFGKIQAILLKPSLGSRCIGVG